MTTTATSTTTDVPMGNSVAPLQVHSNANASMVCGIISIFVFGPILGPIAICLGTCAKKEIEANPNKYTGTKQANTGIYCGIAGLVIWAILLIIILSSPSA